MKGNDVKAGIVRTKYVVLVGLTAGVAAVALLILHPARRPSAPPVSNEALLRQWGMPAPDQAVATWGGERILAADFYQVLVRQYGQHILAQQLQDVLIRQEAARRGVKAADSEVEAKVALVREELGKEHQPGRTLEGLLAPKGMTLEQFKGEIRQQILLEKMIRQDLCLPDTANITDEQVGAWVEGVRSRASIRSRGAGVRPGIAAVVNGEEMPEANVLKELTARLDRGEMEKILDRLLNDRIVEKLMKERTIPVKSSDLEAATRRMEIELQKKPGLAGVTLENYLRANGKTLDDVREQFRHDLGLRKLVANEVTEAQLRAAFQEAPDAFNGKLVHAQHILAAAVDLRTMQPTDPHAFERAKVKIINIQARLQKGARFEDLARVESDDPGTARQGGDLGFIRRLGDVIEELAAMAFLLKENEVSPPVRSPYGYHLAKVIEIRPGKPVKFEDVRNDVMATLVGATCNRWLEDYKKTLGITKNLGNMGRGPAGVNPPAKP